MRKEIIKARYSINFLGIAISIKEETSKLG